MRLWAKLLIGALVLVLVAVSALFISQVGPNDYRGAIADIVEDVVPGCRIEYAEGGGPDPRCYRVDCGKLARTLPDFKTEWNARRGVEELYDAYKRVGLTLEEFQGPRYMRIKHIQDLLGDGRLDQTLRWNEADSAHLSDRSVSFAGTA